MCTTGEVCVEDEERCAPACSTPDVDGDGHDSVLCGGDDCDDEDGARHPGATEVCDAGGVDEDCDPSTLGALDADGDGHVSASCCNGDSCGPDCDDGASDVAPSETELCNARDDDCDGVIDPDDAYCPSGVCVASRCRGTTWERVFGPHAGLGIAVGPRGEIFVVGLAGGDLDGDPLTPDSEPPGHYALALSPIGELDWVSAALGETTAIAAAPDGSELAIGLDSPFGEDVLHIEILSAATGSSLRSLAIPIDPDLSQNLTVASIQWTGEGLTVVAQWYRLDSGIDRYGPMILRVDPADGSVDWQVVVDNTRATASGVAVSTAGIAWAATFEAPAVLGGESRPAGQYLIRLDHAGDVLGVDALTELPTAAAISESGEIAIASQDGVRLYAPDGAFVWHALDGAEVLDVSFDGRGGLLTGGFFRASLDVTPLGTWAVGSADGGQDGFMAILRVNDAFPLDARRLRGAGVESIAHVAVDTFGAYVVSGRFRGTTELFRGDYTSSTYPGGASADDDFIARVSD